MIAHSFYRLHGGEDGYVRQQVELLGTRHEVELLARSNESLAANLSTAIAMTYSPRLVQAVEADIARFAPDVIHLHNPYPALGSSVHLAAERLGIPLIQTVHNSRLRCPNGLMFTEGQPCRRCEAGNYSNALIHACFPSRSQAGAYAGALWVHRFVMKLEDKVRVFIAPSEYMSKRLLTWGIPPNRVRMIRNFAPRVPASRVVGTFGTYVGRLGSEKGIDVLLRAVALAGNPPFRIVGDGPMEPSLKRIAAELGLKNTAFLGRVDPSEVSRILEESRFLVMPSISDENAPMAVLEAMASGKPVLVTRMGGLPELVRGGTGLVCEPGDDHSMASNIRRLLADDELCATLGGQARSFAQNELSAEGHVIRLEATYREVATRPINSKV
jgi:glycosyltransferase involved in cell wall biosynthesis